MYHSVSEEDTASCGHKKFCASVQKKAGGAGRLLWTSWADGNPGAHGCCGESAQQGRGCQPVCKYYPLLLQVFSFAAMEKC